MKVTTDGFEATYNKYKNTVYSVIFNYVHNVDDTSDLSQDVFLKLLDCNKEFESEEHLKAWIIKVSINRCKNHFRFLVGFRTKRYRRAFTMIIVMRTGSS